MSKNIAFQGELGAYSHMASLKVRPGASVVPCATFEGTIAAVQTGKADLAVLPVENSIYGRVADIHSLLPESGLFIVDEVFVRINVSLLVVPGTTLSDIKSALSHSVLLGQCRKFFRTTGVAPVAWADTAGSARHVAELGDRSQAALASELAAEIYGLEVAKCSLEDEGFNRTRFVIMSPERNLERRGDQMITSFVFQVRNIPASLYKVLGGFATNGINIVKLESYMVGGSFSATQFFAEIEGHPDDEDVELAFQELRFFSDMFTLIGTYPVSSQRRESQDK